MPNPFESYFDFSSPYGYLANEKVVPLPGKLDSDANWPSFLPGAAFKTTGDSPLSSNHMKSTYRIRRDVEIGMTMGVLDSPCMIGEGEPSRSVNRRDLVEKWLVGGAY